MVARLTPEPQPGDGVAGLKGDFVTCPPWLCDHIAEEDPYCSDIQDSSHYCDTCGPWMTRWQDEDVPFPKGFIQPSSGVSETNGIWPYNSFTSLCGLWTTPQFFADCCNFYDRDRDGIPNSVIEYSIAFASELLYRLSGRQYPGACERLIYPGCPTTGMTGAQYRDLAYLRDTDYGRCCDVGTCGGGSSSCSSKCSDRYTLRLPGPISNILEIVINGEVLSPNSYQIRAHKEVVRTDGKPWPASNDFSRSPYMVPTEDDCGTAWVVRYLHGKCPPISAQLAAAELARITAKSVCGNNCLPENVRRITAEGIDVRILERDSSLYNLRSNFGNVIIDSWLNSVNPAGLQRSGSVHRADRLKKRHSSFRNDF